jgi:hydrogenase maturation factor
MKASGVLDHCLVVPTASIHRIQECHVEPGRVTMRTEFGGRRIIDMLVGEQLPRIC